MSGMTEGEEDRTLLPLGFYAASGRERLLLTKEGEEDKEGFLLTPGGKNGGCCAAGMTETGLVIERLVGRF